MYIRRNYPTTKPLNTATINRTAKISQNLIAAYALNQGGGNTLYDLAGNNNITNFLPAGGGSATWNSGKVALDQSTGGWALASDVFKINPPVTIAWYGYMVSTPGNFIGLFGADYDNVGSNPFTAYHMVTDNTGKIAGYFNRSGSFTAIIGGTSTSSLVNPTKPLFVLFTGTNNDQRLYINNYQDAANSFTWTGINYSATTRMGFTIPTTTTQPAGSCFQGIWGLAWNRLFSKEDALELYQNPYSWMNPQRSPIFYSIPGVAGAQIALAGLSESATGIAAFVSVSKTLTAQPQSASGISAALRGNLQLASIIDSATGIDVLLYRDTTIGSVSLQSASTLSVPKLYAAYNLPSATLSSASTISARLGLLQALTVNLGSQSGLLSGLSSQFIGGLAAFSIQIQPLSPVAALDTGRRPIAIISANSDNEAAINPNLPNESPDDNTWF